MYASIITSLLTFGNGGRRRTGRQARRLTDFSEFNEHTLRDIGLTREPTAWHPRHFMRF